MVSQRIIGVLKTNWIIIAISSFLFFLAIIHLFGGIKVPTLTVVFLSAVALLTSIADLLEYLQVKKRFLFILYILLIICLVLALYFWGSPINIGDKASRVGDAFTMIGMAAVILIQVIRDLIKAPAEEDNSILSDEVIASNALTAREIEEVMVNHEYEKVMTLNDIIIELNNITKTVFQQNRVHDGWAIFSDTLIEHWNNWNGPFHDGLNRKLYNDFLNKLNSVCEQISLLSDPDPRRSTERNIMMWDETIPITINPAITNRNVRTVKQVYDELNAALDSYYILKKQISDRYEKVRSAKKNAG